MKARDENVYGLLPHTTNIAVLQERLQNASTLQRDCFNRYCVERWRRIKAEEVERMGGVCKDCGGVFHPDVYDFHHEDPREKEYQWTKLRLLSAERRRAELAKCVLLCANCHRLRHAYG